MLEVLIDYLTMPQQVIKPNRHMAFLTDKSLIHCNKLAILLYCVTTYVCMYTVGMGDVKISCCSIS